MQCENPAAALGTTPAAALCSEAATGISNLAGAVSAGEPCSDHGHPGEIATQDTVTLSTITLGPTRKGLPSLLASSGEDFTTPVGLRLWSP